MKIHNNDGLNESPCIIPHKLHIHVISERRYTIVHQWHQPTGSFSCWSCVSGQGQNRVKGCYLEGHRGTRNIQWARKLCSNMAFLAEFTKVCCTDCWTIYLSRNQVCVSLEEFVLKGSFLCFDSSIKVLSRLYSSILNAESILAIISLSFKVLDCSVWASGMWQGNGQSFSVGLWVVLGYSGFFRHVNQTNFTVWLQ